MGNLEKYNQGKIYKLRCLSTQKVYIGSTILPLNNRLSLHRSAYKRYLKCNTTYNTFFDIIENNNYVIEIVEYYPTTSKEELLKRERYHIDSMDCINKQRPILSDEEKEQYIKDYSITWYSKNREYKKKYQNEKYKWRRLMSNVVFID